MLQVLQAVRPDAAAAAAAASTTAAVPLSLTPPDSPQ